ncbi:hypothetical protein NDU88_007899 [Pleurodeles waltl]|uniref:Uncharacterized protein n=1 Tax=Pleurodeles waltl TaxID=8319 RepID=A0AAV7NW65_PLEWA|nr:hypothetical protein NDU88_007899 [Pleurodeles waltl]
MAGRRPFHRTAPRDPRCSWPTNPSLRASRMKRAEDIVRTHAHATGRTLACQRSPSLHLTMRQKPVSGSLGKRAASSDKVSKSEVPRSLPSAPPLS